MGRQWLLSLLCLSVLFASFVQLTRAGGELRVDEARTRILEGESILKVLAFRTSFKCQDSTRTPGSKQPGHFNHQRGPTDRSWKPDTHSPVANLFLEI